MKTEITAGAKTVVLNVVRFFTPKTPVEKWIAAQNAARLSQEKMEKDFAERIKNIEKLEAMISFLDERYAALVGGVEKPEGAKAFTRAQLQLGDEIYLLNQQLKTARADFNKVYPGHIVKM